MRVWLVGDLMKDVYWIGRASKLSPEAPIPIVKVETTFETIGGAGNVGENLRNLGVEVMSFIPPLPAYPEKHRLMVGNVQVARWDVGDDRMILLGEEAEGVKKALLASLPKINALVVSDYGKGGIPKWMCPVLGSLPCPTFIDTKRDPLVYKPDLNKRDLYFFPNLAEWEKEEESYRRLPWVVVKKGRQGAEVRRFGEAVMEGCFEGEVNAVCTVGAGDSAMAGFVWGWLTRGGEIREALRLCIAAGTASVRKNFTYAPTLEEVMREVQSVRVWERKERSERGEGER